MRVPWAKRELGWISLHTCQNTQTNHHSSFYVFCFLWKYAQYARFYLFRRQFWSRLSAPNHLGCIGPVANTLPPGCEEFRWSLRAVCKVELALVCTNNQPNRLQTQIRRSGTCCRPCQCDHRACRYRRCTRARPASHKTRRWQRLSRLVMTSWLLCSDFTAHLWTRRRSELKGAIVHGAGNDWKANGWQRTDDTIESEQMARTLSHTSELCALCALCARQCARSSTNLPIRLLA